MTCAQLSVLYCKEPRLSRLSSLEVNYNARQTDIDKVNGNQMLVNNGLLALCLLHIQLIFTLSTVD